VQIFGDKGNMRLIGYDWETNGVYLDDSWDNPATLYEKEPGGYVWQEGATKVGESIVNKTEPKIYSLTFPYVGGYIPTGIYRVYTTFPSLNFQLFDNQNIYFKGGTVE
jgi:hypothetical protein